jgi:hypothetical protein
MRNVNGKNKEITVALKNINVKTMKNIEEGTGNSGKTMKNSLETKRKRLQDKKSEFINDLIKQKDVKRIWEAVRSIVRKRDSNTAQIAG